MVYTFLALCLAYVGGPGSVEVKMNGYQLHPSLLYCTCCLPALPVNGAFVRMCKRGTLQFVWTKPVLAGLTVVLYTQHMYTEGYWGPNNGRAPGARPASPLHASVGTKSSHCSRNEADRMREPEQKQSSLLALTRSCG